MHRLYSPNGVGGLQRSSEAFRGYQRSSEDIKVTARKTNGRRGWVPKSGSSL